MSLNRDEALTGHECEPRPRSQVGGIGFRARELERRFEIRGQAGVQADEQDPWRQKGSRDCRECSHARCRVRRNVAQARPAWVRAEYEDEAGASWSELDVAELVRDTEFLAVGD